MNIAIAGYGVEGKSNLAYWMKDPGNTLTIVDERAELAPEEVPEGVSVLTGEGVFGRLDNFDMVVRTAGLAPYKIKTSGKIWSATNEFFAKCPVPIIGVTGSKGKGTTASLIASILEAAGKKVWLVGNIGVAALDILDQIQPEDLVVYELSSFQLWDAEKSPHVAVVLYIEPDHLDVHRNMEEYVEAKAQITRWQDEDDVLIYNERNEYAAHIAASSKARKIGFPASDSAHELMYDEVIKYGEQVICSVYDLAIPGEHNITNAIAAVDAAWIFTQDVAAIKAGLTRFKGLPHRLAFVATKHDVRYYDDSIATTPGSAIAALRAFRTEEKVIILGGSSKGSDFTELAAEMNAHKVKALLIGDEAQTIAAALDAVGFTQYEIIAEPTEGQTIMETVVSRAAAQATPGGVVILSPSAASFGLFKNYADRGDQFIAAVNAL